MGIPRKFTTWLLQQIDRDDAIGDLAQDFQRDYRDMVNRGEAPPTDVWQFRDRIRRLGCMDALNAANAAIVEFLDRRRPLRVRDPDDYPRPNETCGQFMTRMHEKETA